MSSAVSPLAPTEVPDMPVIAGVRLATAAAGIRYKGRTDVLLADHGQGDDCRRRLHQIEMPVRPGGMVPRQTQRRGSSKGLARALVVNSGNANAFTGKTGRQATTLDGVDCRQGGRVQAK